MVDAPRTFAGSAAMTPVEAALIELLDRMRALEGRVGKQLDLLRQHELRIEELEWRIGHPDGKGAP